MKFIMKHASLFALLTMLSLGILIQANEDVTFINGRGLKKGSKKSGKSEKSAKSGKSPKSGKKRSKKDATSAPSSSPSAGPTISPSSSPIEDVMTARKKKSPKSSKTESPSQTPSESPSDAPSESPTVDGEAPSGSPSESPSDVPSDTPSESPTTACLPVPDTEPGLRFQYTELPYTSGALPAIPLQDEFELLEFGVSHDIAENPFLVQNNFAGQFDGYLNIPVKNFQLCLEADEQARLWMGDPINDPLAVEINAVTGEVCKTYDEDRCGPIFILVDYKNENSAPKSVILRWNIGNGKETVPDDAFYQPA